MKKAKYKLIDHTADVGIEVAGANQKELFVNAALAMFDLITKSDDVSYQNNIELHVQGSDYCDLMVNWLRELLYLWNGQKMIVRKITISSISEKICLASVIYELFDPDMHEIKNEIKAVTYHQISVKQTNDGWEARIIFDV